MPMRWGGWRQRDTGRLPTPVKPSDPLHVPPNQRPSHWAIRLVWLSLAVAGLAVLMLAIGAGG